MWLHVRTLRFDPLRSETDRPAEDAQASQSPGRPRGHDGSEGTEMVDIRDPAHASGASVLWTGTLPRRAVPAPGTDRTSSIPPRAARRSAIPCSPVPYDVRTGSNPW